MAGLSWAALRCWARPGCCAQSRLPQHCASLGRMVAAEGRPRIQHYLRHSTTLTLHSVRCARARAPCPRLRRPPQLTLRRVQLDPAQRAPGCAGLLCARHGLPAGARYSPPAWRAIEPLRADRRPRRRSWSWTAQPWPCGWTRSCPRPSSAPALPPASKAPAVLRPHSRPGLQVRVRGHVRVRQPPAGERQLHR